MSAVSSQSTTVHQPNVITFGIKVLKPTDHILLRIFSSGNSNQKPFERLVQSVNKGFKVSIPYDQTGKTRKIQLIGYKSKQETGSTYEATTMILRGCNPKIIF